MINLDSKKGIFQMTGTPLDLLTEFTVVARTLRGILVEGVSNEMADDLLQKAFDLSKKTDEEVKEEANDIALDVVRKLLWEVIK